MFRTSPVRVAFAIRFHSFVVFTNFLVKFSSLGEKSRKQILQDDTSNN